MSTRPKAPPAAPERPTTITLVDRDQWVACSTSEFGHVGHDRHIARPGARVTVCGNSASHPEIWRRNTTKPRCVSCMTWYRTQQEQR